MIPYPVAFSPEARTHLLEIEAYLAERFYPDRARQFVQRLTQACLAIGNAPYQGTKRDDLAPGMRSTGFERRVKIYFRLVDDRVYIIGLFYGGRQYEASR